MFGGLSIYSKRVISADLEWSISKEKLERAAPKKMFNTKIV